MSNVILLPTYNERENLPHVTERIFKILPEVRLLVVDDNSPDGTGEVVEALRERFPGLICLHRQGPRGYGPATIDGFRWALAEGAKKVIQMDADLSHPPEVLPKLLEMSERFDLVLGSRYVAGGGTPDWPLRRRLLSRAANFYARNLLGLKVRDVTTGFRCFSRQALEQIDFQNLRSKGYGFLVEFIYRVSKLGFTIGEVPILFKDRTQGQSKMGLHIAWEGAVNVLKMRVRAEPKPLVYTEDYIKPHQ